MSGQIKTGSLFRYALLALPLAFAGLPIYMLAPDFYAVSFELSLAVIGAGLLGLRLIDAVLDPLLGVLIDRYPTRLKDFSFFAAGILLVGFFMLFTPPALAEQQIAAWFFTSIFFVTLGFSALTIIYGSLGAVWSEHSQVQTEITTWREALTLVGLVLSVTLPTLLMQQIEPVLAYKILAWIFSGLFIWGYLSFLPIQNQISNRFYSGSEDIRESREKSSELNVSLVSLYCIYAISNLASALPAVLVIFFVRDYLGSEIMIGIALCLYFLAGAATMPLWRRLSARTGKKRAWQFAMILAVGSFAWVCLIPSGAFVSYAIVCLLSGAALGAEMALPPAILAEILKPRERSERGKNTALKYSGLTMTAKLSLALAAGICLPILDKVGFIPGGQNSETAMFTLVILYGAVPCVLKLFALWLTQVWIGKTGHRYENTGFNSDIGSMRNGS